MNNRKLILSGTLFVSLVIILIACDKKVGKLQTPVTATPAVGACDTITYVKHIKPLIDTKCNTCHGNPLSGGAPIFLTNYGEVKAAADNGTIKADVITSDAMPFGGPPLTQAEKNLINCWLNNGNKQ